ncbi:MULTISPECIES: GNAT family N-acetyltransferase [unclassified Haematobacter]|uniref:GNAT family N-acetyltransferase n=1 Tax=unclassified Haematobacter TaxID=2640585 RepID=UPI0025BC333D|nr:MULTISPECIES: GNAT family N-acetyltransferase [unclassified Haematobacter]
MTYGEVMDATWPAESLHRAGAWLIRVSPAAGGKRVQAITPAEPDAPDPEEAIRAARALGQRPIFRVEAEDDALDTRLAAAGLTKIDPVIYYTAPTALVVGTGPKPVTGFTIWEPLQLMLDIWADCGTAPERIEVMHRVKGPKTALLGRSKDRASGVGFVALAGDRAMVHSLAVLPAFRRMGAGRNMMQRAALWSMEQGAEEIALAVEAENTGARALYDSLGMRAAGGYHYRVGGDD